MTDSNSVPYLAQPWNLGDLKLKNRIVMASLTRNRNLVPNKVNVDYYEQRSTTGLIISEGILIEPQGTTWLEAPGIWSNKQIQGWKRVTEAVHAKGGVIFAQLWHLGRIAHPLHNAGQLPPGPSAVAASGGNYRLLVGSPGHPVPQEIEDPKYYVEMFKKAAINAKLAGFDGVELLGANGYLSHQFLDSGSNLRTDIYGESIENRSRFTLEVIKALIEVYPANRVGIKLSPCGGYNDVGERTVEATKEIYNYLIEELDNLKIGYIQLFRHLKSFDLDNRGAPFDLAYYALKIKNCAIILNGEFSKEEGNIYIEEGLSTAIAFGRVFIPNPDLVYRFINGKELSQITDIKSLYAYPNNDKHIGYSDYSLHVDNPEKL